MVVFASLMAALTALGAYIYVPIGPVPIVLSTLFVLLSGLLFGKRDPVPGSEYFRGREEGGGWK